MSQLDVPHTRELLQGFEFGKLFTEQLGWSQPKQPRPVRLSVEGADFELREIAQLGAAVLEVEAADGAIPDSRTRAAVQREVAKRHHENLLIFVDRQRRESLWQWAKREGTRLYPRDHYFSRNQPGDLFLSKLAGLVVDIAELEQPEGVPIAEIARRLRRALDVERVTKRFYSEYETQHLAFIEHIQGIASERDRRWYASVLLNRLMFVYFLQKKGFLDRGDRSYLRSRFDRSQEAGPDRYYRGFLLPLFFEGFAKPEPERSPEARALLGEVRYLDGGLFLRHRIEAENPGVAIPDQAFASLLDLFDRYSWSLDDTPGGKDDEINPDVLGYIFEKYINQKAFGAYYTRPEITEYLCEQTIYRLILDRVNGPEIPGVPDGRQFDSIEELLLKLDSRLCTRLLVEVLPSLSILDPACGSGAFLVAALKTLINVYSAVIGKIEFVNAPQLRTWRRKATAEHRSLNYFIKKRIITDNLFGVDIMEEATEIAKLRLFLALVASAHSAEELEPLPNIDFNILTGNSLIGLLQVDDVAFNARLDQGNLFHKSYRQLLDEKNRLIQTFRHATSYAEDLRALRDGVEAAKREALPALDAILLGEFQAHKIRVEEAIWDLQKNASGKPRRRPVTIEDVQALQPFHWGYEFDQALGRGGFDAILTNPPWEAWKPQAKEFFAEHSDLVTKNIMTIKEFEREQAKLLRDPEVRTAWLAYLSRFPHVSAYFRSAPQYPNQIARVRTVDGKEKKAGTDVNLYKLFLEQCFNLLRPGGRCGILLPTGVYTDLGAKQLREMLFSQTRIQALFGLSNERFLFEGLDHRFRICLLSFQKGAVTTDFPAAFRIDPREAIAADRLESFLHNAGEHLLLSVDLIRRLSPGSISLLEFKDEADVRIAEKTYRFPLLGERLEGSWNLELTREFDMTNDSGLFKAEPQPGRLPLYEGKMIHQFDHRFSAPRYWLDETEARKALLRNAEDCGQPLSYQQYRLGFRDVASSTNERTMIAAIVPPSVFCGNTVIVSENLEAGDLPVVAALLNSFVYDFLIRKRVTSHCNMFYVYQMAVPRLSRLDPIHIRISQPATRLICTSPEFADLWLEATGTPWSRDLGATDPEQRARLRAELDGLVAHLYGLTEDEFAHVLSTFPVVPQETKDVGGCENPRIVGC
jgi:Eco57I restriction-modification methylase